jgi:hypothetical protein
MTKYNANGGQRRSQKTKFELPRNYVECGYCAKKLAMGTPELKNWEMQHLHFAEDKEIQFMTCGECKKKSPMDWLAKLGVEL